MFPICSCFKVRIWSCFENLRAYEIDVISTAFYCKISVLDIYKKHSPGTFCDRTQFLHLNHSGQTFHSPHTVHMCEYAV